MAAAAAAREAKALADRVVQDFGDANKLREHAAILNSHGDAFRRKFLGCVCSHTDARTLDGFLSWSALTIEFDDHYLLRLAASTNHSTLVRRLLAMPRVRQGLQAESPTLRSGAPKPIRVARPPMNTAPSGLLALPRLNSIAAMLVYNVALNDELAPTLAVLLADEGINDHARFVPALVAVSPRPTGANGKLVLNHPKLSKKAVALACQYARLLEFHQAQPTSESAEEATAVLLRTEHELERKHNAKVWQEVLKDQRRQQRSFAAALPTPPLVVSAPPQQTQNDDELICRPAKRHCAGGDDVDADWGASDRDSAGYRGK